VDGAIPHGIEPVQHVLALGRVVPEDTMAPEVDLAVPALLVILHNGETIQRQAVLRAPISGPAY
jgi:hypothetical protein